MSTPEYGQREDFYHAARLAAIGILKHRSFEAPEHPYHDDLRFMLDYSNFGVVDIGNGIVNVTGTLVRHSVVIVPFLLSDIRTSLRRGSNVTLADNLYRARNKQDVQDVVMLKEMSAYCALDSSFVNPMIGLSPWLAKRDSLTLGSALLHEIDHAYWWWNRRKLLKHGSIDSYTGRAQIETSAYRLEQQAYFAVAPKEYDNEYAYIGDRFASLDFSRPYIPRDKDRRRRAIRCTAFVNFLLDSVGAEVGKRPTPKVLQAMKQQGLIY